MTEQIQPSGGNTKPPVGPLDIEQKLGGVTLMGDNKSLKDDISSAVDALSGGRDLSKTKENLLKIFQGPNFSSNADAAKEIIDSCKDAQQVEALEKALGNADTLFNSRNDSMTVKDKLIAVELQKVMTHEDMKSEANDYAAKLIDSNDVLLLRTLVQASGLDSTSIQDIRSILYTTKRVGRNFPESIEKDKGQDSTSTFAATLASAIRMSKTDGVAKTKGLNSIDLYYGAMVVGGTANFKGEEHYYAEGKNNNLVMGAIRIGETVRYAHEFSTEPIAAIQHRPKHVIEVAERVKSYVSDSVNKGPGSEMNQYYANAIIARLRLGAGPGGDIGEDIKQVNDDVVQIARTDEQRRKQQAKAVHEANQANQEEIRKPQNYIIN